MTLSADIRDAWETYVFQSAIVQAITDKYYNKEISQESEAEVSQGYDDGQISFFEYVVTPTEHNYNLIGGANSPEQIFIVEVRYTKYAEPLGSAYNDCIDALETIISASKTLLGDTWQNTIDFVESPISIEAPQAYKFNETDCFRAVARFTARKQI